MHIGVALAEGLQEDKKKRKKKKRMLMERTRVVEIAQSANRISSDI